MYVYGVCNVMRGKKIGVTVLLFELRNTILSEFHAQVLL